MNKSRKGSRTGGGRAERSRYCRKGIREDLQRMNEKWWRGRGRRRGAKLEDEISKLILVERAIGIKQSAHGTDQMKWDGKANAVALYLYILR